MSAKAGREAQSGAETETGTQGVHPHQGMGTGWAGDCARQDMVHPDWRIEAMRLGRDVRMAGPKKHRVVDDVVMVHQEQQQAYSIDTIRWCFCWEAMPPRSLGEVVALGGWSWKWFNCFGVHMSSAGQV